MSNELTIACKMRGNQILDLIFANSGVLVYEGNTLTFIDPNTMETKKYTLCNPAYIGRIIFISNLFELKNLLDPQEVYKIIFERNYLYFETLDGRLDVVIEGIVY